MKTFSWTWKNRTFLRSTLPVRDPGGVATFDVIEELAVGSYRRPGELERQVPPRAVRIGRLTPLDSDLDDLLEASPAGYEVGIRRSAGGKRHGCGDHRHHQPQVQRRATGIRPARSAGEIEREVFTQGETTITIAESDVPVDREHGSAVRSQRPGFFGGCCMAWMRFIVVTLAASAAFLAATGG
jgi:hypothetical protein